MTDLHNTVNDDNTENIETGFEGNENVDTTIEDYTDTDNGTDELAQLREQLERKEKAFQDQKRRAEKAELRKSPESNTTDNNTLSQKDIIAVVKADIADEDLDTVIKYAKLEGTSVTDALKDNTLKAVLASKAEERKTASVANSGRQRGGVSTDNIEVIKDNVSKGKMPEGDKLKKFLRDRYSV